MFRLDGKLVIVTGASSGLGVSFAQACADVGAHVVLAAWRTEKLAATAALVSVTGQRSFVVETDVTDPRQCQATVDAAMADLDGSTRW